MDTSTSISLAVTDPRAPAARRRIWLAAAAAVTLAASATGCSPAKAAQPPANVTVVLVHGALTDASVWSDVTRQLQSKGYPVLAPALPLRGLASDSAYLSSLLKTVQGRVVLVGHSYAGAVITQAGAAGPNVEALVYVAAFQPDSGETAGALNAQFPGSKLGPDTTVVRANPGGSDLYLKPESFRDVYAGSAVATTSAASAGDQPRRRSSSSSTRIRASASARAFASSSARFDSDSRASSTSSPLS